MSDRIIFRDPFARTELHKSSVWVDEGSPLACAWCGSPGVRIKDGTRRLSQFSTHHDSGRVETNSKAYCSTGCYRANVEY